MAPKSIEEIPDREPEHNELTVAPTTSDTLLRRRFSSTPRPESAVEPTDEPEPLLPARRKLKFLKRKVKIHQKPNTKLTMTCSALVGRRDQKKFFGWKVALNIDTMKAFHQVSPKHESD